MKTQSEIAIEEFVRGPLGCNCGAKVFERIEVEEKPSDFEDLSASQLIGIGGILLVLVLNVDAWESTQTNLESIFKRGIETREAKSFNRFRLVVATPQADKARQALTQHFETFSEMDEKIHLHIVTPDQLPAYTAAL